ncbi:CCA tRNA nucleotidyltransferase, mitochondrial [Puccinia graminis f. sp. tritici]|uniref:CCA tRNA nucleotidyltransferase, mitochondrial n=1 Tax=Puccinia graminis f. sp. tritici TaxID=56615 RepID=A0A5B0QEH0_PUCGR|nr:CCA tRNA nucleotidyltransferase, mitochondrial [Puccinia graminis f. sp. tritici]
MTGAGHQESSVFLDSPCRSSITALLMTMTGAGHQESEAPLSGLAIKKAVAPHLTAIISTIEARPNQSKHLETATITFLGLELDFVQLRSEEYSDQDSRIPSSVVETHSATCQWWQIGRQIAADHPQKMSSIIEITTEPWRQQSSAAIVKGLQLHQ